MNRAKEAPNSILEREARRLDEAHEVEAAVELLLSNGHNSRLSGEAHYRLVRLLLEMSEVEQAHEIGARALDEDVNVWTLSATSHIYQSIFNEKDALRFAEQAWATDDRSPEAGYALHSAQLLAGEECTARLFLTQLVDMFPDHPEIQIEYACRAELSPTAQSSALEALQKRFAQIRTLHFVRATVRSALHDLEGAQATCDWLINTVPSSHQYLGMGALIALQQGRKQKAASLAREALGRSQYAFMGHLTLFHCALESKDEAQARSIIEGVYPWIANTINEASFLPQMWLDLDEVDMARSLLRQIAERFHDTPEVAMGLARVACAERAYTDALGWAQEAKRLWPLHYEVVVTEARIRYELEDSDGALALLEGMPASESVDVLRLKARRLQEDDFLSLVAAYEAHLQTYPSFDYVWGILLRFYLEAKRDADVERLLGFPRAVPDYVRNAVIAYQNVIRNDLPAAEEQLTLFLRNREINRNWQWCWELIVDALEAPGLAHWLVPLSEAAQTDGV